MPDERTRRLVAALCRIAICALLLCAWERPVAAQAVDQPISAIKLIIKISPSGSEKMVFVAKDPAFLFPPLGGLDDPANGSPGGAIIDILTREFGPMNAIGQSDPGAPATDFEFADGGGRIGLIASVSQPFCMSCNRFRVTADGKLRNCLFSLEETDVKAIIRGGGSDEEIAEALKSSIAATKEGHEINTARFIHPDRPMYSIGG